MSDIPVDPTDARDERIAARLQTEPLDEVTRTRLVRAALAASQSVELTSARRRPRSPARWLAVAAAIVVVLAIGFAVVASNGDDSGPTAARSPGRTTGLTVADGSDGALFSITDDASLGDLGEVGNKAELRRAIAAVQPAPASRESKSEGAPQAATALPSTESTGCVSATLRNVVAVGTGTARGHAVTVYVVENKDGARTAVVLGADCEVERRVPL